MTFLGRETGSLIRKGPAFYFLGKLGLFSCLQNLHARFCGFCLRTGLHQPGVKSSLSGSLHHRRQAYCVRVVHHCLTVN